MLWVYCLSGSLKTRCVHCTSKRQSSGVSRLDGCKNSNAWWASVSSQNLMAFFVQCFTTSSHLAARCSIISSRWSFEVADVRKWDSVVCRGQGLLVWITAGVQGVDLVCLSAARRCQYPSLPFSLAVISDARVFKAALLQALGPLQNVPLIVQWIVPVHPSYPISSRV